jgi:hypothetical protein
MMTDAAGTFTFANVPQGSYELRITPPVGYVAPEPVQLAVTDEANEMIEFMVESNTSTIFLPMISR